MTGYDVVKRLFGEGNLHERTKVTLVIKWTNKPPATYSVTAVFPNFLTLLDCSGDRCTIGKMSSMSVSELVLNKGRRLLGTSITVYLSHRSRT